jgi:hypothetical protein
MNMLGPDRFALTFDSRKFIVRCPKNTDRFSGFATSNLPKLYIASVDDWPIYVGITKQSMRSRLRLGWNADGENGYHGYAWRHHHQQAALDIWCQTDPPAVKPTLDIETVEAEVVFLIRSAGQWPAFQTEIHFHQSSEVHRAAAARILATFRCPNPPVSPPLRLSPEPLTDGQSESSCFS